jgi:hypothetical protein
VDDVPVSAAGRKRERPAGEKTGEAAIRVEKV